MGMYIVSTSAKSHNTRKACVNMFACMCVLVRVRACMCVYGCTVTNKLPSLPHTCARACVCLCVHVRVCVLARARVCVLPTFWLYAARLINCINLGLIEGNCVNYKAYMKR